MRKIVYIAPSISSSPNKNMYQKAKMIAFNFDGIAVFKRTPPVERWPIVNKFSSCYFWDKSKRRLPYFLWAILQITKIIKKNRAVWLYSSWHAESMAISIILNLLTGTKFVIDLWDDPKLILNRLKLENDFNISVLFDYFKGAASAFLAVFAVRLASIVVTSQPFIVNKRYNVDPGKIVVHYNGFDAGYIYKKHKSLNLANFDKHWNHLVFIGSVRLSTFSILPELCDHLYKTNLPIIIHLVGPCDYVMQKKVSELASKYKSHLKVIYYGTLSNDKCLWMISQSDICLYTSLRSLYSEHVSPVKIFEYMAFGKPVVAFKLPALVDIFNTYNIGFLVENGNIPEYSQAIKNIIINPELQSFFNRQSLLASKHFEWENIQKYLYNRVSTLMQYLDNSGK